VAARYPKGRTEVSNEQYHERPAVFLFGNSQFILTGKGVAQVNTIVTDPNTGIQTDNKATLHLK
jgi:hypothetical protein